MEDRDPRSSILFSGHSLSPVDLVSSGIGIYDPGSEKGTTQIIYGGSL
jgi:hypothetical protein